MLCQFRILHRFTQRFSPSITTTRTRTRSTNAPRLFVPTNSLCTIANSQHPPESPELPPWVMFSDDPSPSNSDDDFVIPSLAHWVDSNILETKPSLFPKPTLEESAELEHVDAISNVLKEHYSSPELLSRTLDIHGFRVSDSLVMQILKRFNNDWVLAFGFFKWAKTQTPYVHSPEHYNFMVDVLGKFKKFDLMWELVKEMSQIEGYVTLETMTKVMRRYAKSRGHEEAVEAFRRMDEFGVEKDRIALNKLMDALVKGQNVEVAHNVLIEFKDSIPLSSASFNILINGWCRVGKYENARKVMEERKQHGFEPDVFTYNNFIEAYCHNKDFRKVDQVLEEMKESGCSPNAVTYTIMLLAYGKAEQLSKALEAYERMKNDGIVADTPFYSSLIYILGKAGRLKDACDVFEDMPKQGIVRDVVTFNTMISTACVHSKEETALRLLKEMEESSCKPDIRTYHPLLKMCCKKKRMKVLKFLLDHMFKNDLSPDLGTYTLMVLSLCKSGKLVEACAFFEEMVLKGLTPMQSTVKVLVGKLEFKSMLKEKEHIEELMARVVVKDNI